MPRSAPGGQAGSLTAGSFQPSFFQPQEVSPQAVSTEEGQKQLFPTWLFDGFLKRRIPGKNGEGTSILLELYVLSALFLEKASQPQVKRVFSWFFMWCRWFGWVGVHLSGEFPLEVSPKRGPLGWLKGNQRKQRGLVAALKRADLRLIL